MHPPQAAGKHDRLHGKHERPEARDFLHAIARFLADRRRVCAYLPDNAQITQKFQNLPTKDRLPRAAQSTHLSASPFMPQQYEPGTMLLGRYVVERLLGEGGMGAVYQARHAQLERKKFAIKTLRTEQFGMGEVEQRFRREVDVLAALNHPGIVSLVDYGVEGRTPVMVMELLEGETLRDRLARERQLSLPETLRIVQEVASALDYTHRHSPTVIHRDLKPENLFLTAPDRRAKVLDFGIAKVAGSHLNLTQASTALGTPQYMSPEQLRDAKNVDVTTDIFTLASIAFECLIGTLAFPGEGIAGVVLAIFDSPRQRPSMLRSDVPPAVDSVLARAWALESRHRFATAGEFAAALHGAASGVASSRVPPPNVPTGSGMLAGHSTNDPAPPVARTAHRRTHVGSANPLLIGAAVAVLAIVTGIGFAWSRKHSSEPALTTAHATAVARALPPDRGNRTAQEEDPTSADTPPGSRK